MGKYVCANFAAIVGPLEVELSYNFYYEIKADKTFFWQNKNVFRNF
jgi:hypothetical protein